MSALPTTDPWQQILDAIGNAQEGAGNGGFVEGQSDALDWANLIGGNVPILGDILGLVSRQSLAANQRKQADEANKANDLRYAQRLGLNTQQQNLANDQLNTTGQFLYDRLRRAGDAYGDAEKAITGVGDSATRGILDNQTAQLGAATQAARGRGFYNGSPLDDAQRGVISDTNRNLAGLNESIGQLRSNFAARKADTVSGLEGDLANFMTGRTRFQTGLLGDRSNVINDRTDTANFTAMLPYLAQAKGGSSGGGGTLGGIGKFIGGLFG